MDIDKSSVIRLIRSDFSSRLIVIYDGECPVCKSLTLYSQLNEAFNSLDLINAREIKRLVSELKSKYHIDINQGILVLLDDELYFGGEALKIIGLNSRKDDFKGKVINRIFKHEFISVNLYPMWKFLRSVLLVLLGKNKL